MTSLAELPLPRPLLPCLLSLLCMPLMAATPIEKDLSEEGVRLLKIPGFNESGRIAWELHANEVSFKKDGVYEAFDLFLQTMTGFNQSEAQSEQGLFQPESGKAWGEKRLRVNGKGFVAEGSRWLWRNKIDRGDQLMAFKENAKVSFNDNLLPDDREGEGAGEKNESAAESEDDGGGVFKTMTEAIYIEILEVSPTQNRFLLEGKVEVVSSNLRISCDWMEILFEKDGNRSLKSDELGKISLISATGKVRMIQEGRSSRADKLILNAVEGEALLEGNATVEDASYGIVKGDQIILERGRRRAKVLGKDGNRPSLQLPDIPGLEFPFK